VQTEREARARAEAAADAAETAAAAARGAAEASALDAARHVRELQAGAYTRPLFSST
jgi:hypothetical protein